MDKKEAAAILGVKEKASKEEVSLRYNVLLKKMKNTEENDKTADMGKINQAYKIMMNYEFKDPEDSRPVRQNFLLKKLGIDQKKFNNFMYYYKVHIIVAIIIALVLFFTIKDARNRVVPDLEITTLGKIYVLDIEKVQEKIAGILKIKAAGVQNLLIDPEGDPQINNASMMKAMAITASGEIDIYICDDRLFKQYSKQGAFSDLTNTATRLGLDMNKYKNGIIEISDTKEKKLLGFDVTNNKFLKDNGFIGKKMFISVRIEAKHKENAMLFLDYIMKQQEGKNGK